MKKVKELSAICGLSLIVLSSCKTIYRTNAVNTPLFKKKGEVQSNLTTGSGGTELQLAYSLSDNIAFMANGVYDLARVRAIDTAQSLSTNVRDINDNYQNAFVEGAVGYYKTFQPDTSNMFSIFVGGGAGNTSGYSDRWEIDYLSYEGSYYRMFLQPSFGRIKKHVEFSVATRLSLLNYYRLDAAKNNSFSTNGFNAFIDPVATLKTGPNQFKFIFQLGSSIPLKKDNFYSATPLMFSVGFHLNFTRYWEKQIDFTDEY